jgi:hypothetical protein
VNHPRNKNTQKRQLFNLFCLFPSAHIFLGTGETLPYDTTAFKRGRELLDFLFRQTQVFVIVSVSDQSDASL